MGYIYMYFKIEFQVEVRCEVAVRVIQDDSEWGKQRSLQFREFAYSHTALILGRKLYHAYGPSID
jgi:hypothetical protein